MKTAGRPAPRDGAAGAMVDPPGDRQTADVPAEAPVDPPDQLHRSRAFAQPLLAGQTLDTGEDAQEHADGMAAILQAIGAAPSIAAAAYLVYAGDYLQRPDEVVGKAFGASYAELVSNTRKLVQIQRAARAAQGRARAGGKAVGGGATDDRAQQIERVRKMLLAFSRDLRVVLLRLASRLQTLRHYAASRQPCPDALAAEALQVFAPLANRLGIWQLKWEIEDLAFRFLQPAVYRSVAGLLDETRAARERGVAAFCDRLAGLLQPLGIAGIDVHGRPKHLYSIWKKMQGKQLGFERVFDVQALRVVVPDVADCYAVLSRVHDAFRPVAGEYDDYIARPKANGYQSLHTVVLASNGRPVEVQVRTRVMHEHAEHGVAAHWAYKEAGVKGYGGGAAADAGDAQATEARKAVLRQLLAWERELSDGADGADSADGPAQARSSTAGAAAGSAEPPADPRIYVFTPNATLIELPAGATPLDFAYVVHTDLGHRCRGARVNGALVPLNTPLASGQTVQISAAREGGPSLDWLNPELGYLQSARSKAKVRAWFNAVQLAQTVARGRDAVERLLQRLGCTALRHDELAARLGLRNAAALFEVVGKEELSLRHVEHVLRPPAEPPPTADEAIAERRARPLPDESPAGGGGVLVVGVASLMTQLARCCRPAPPDAIGGYVTRGKGVAVHRRDCRDFREMSRRAPERLITVGWGSTDADNAVGGRPALYPVDVIVEAADRAGLLRDVTEVFAKQGMNLGGVNTRSVADSGGGSAFMTFTVQLTDTARLPVTLDAVTRIPGVRSARRR